MRSDRERRALTVIAVSSLMIWRTVQERMADLIAACEAELDSGSAPAP
ncbi:hypothetical protein [Methylobacterium sp. A54F]